MALHLIPVSVDTLFSLVIPRTQDLVSLHCCLLSLEHIRPSVLLLAHRLQELH